MPITKDPSVQDVSVKSVDINFGDVTSGVDANAIDIPPNSVILFGHVFVGTAFNAATSDVIDVGDSVSQNRYLNDGNIHATGIVALVPTGYVHAGGPLTVRVVSVGTPTAGKVRLTVGYATLGKASSTYEI